MTSIQIIAIAVFALALVAIMSERIHRAVVAMIGALLLVFLRIMDFDTAVSYIDFNTLGVLLGMMMYVAVVQKSGLFEYLAIRCARIAKGQPWHVMVMFVLLTACLSAILDNVTTVLLVAPMTLMVCKVMELDPIPFFMAEVMASNIGGTATLIGDPPNIMIGSGAGLTAIDFLNYDAPAAILCVVVLLGIFYVLFGRDLSIEEPLRQKIMSLDESEHLKKPKLARLSVIMTVIVTVALMCHSLIGVDSSVIAMSAAAIMLVMSHESIEEILSHVEWTTLVFFGGLFIIVGGLSETGVVSMLANVLIDATGGSVFMLMIVLLFGSALISSFLDNIPFVATLIPILLAMQSTGVDVTPLWWAVSLGACLGGNGTLIGASANVVMSDIASRNGYSLTFSKFTKVGFPTMLATIAVSAVYLIVRFPPF